MEFISHDIHPLSSSINLSPQIYLYSVGLYALFTPFHSIMPTELFLNKAVPVTGSGIVWIWVILDFVQDSTLQQQHMQHDASIFNSALSCEAWELFIYRKLNQFMIFFLNQWTVGDLHACLQYRRKKQKEPSGYQRNKKAARFIRRIRFETEQTSSAVCRTRAVNHCRVLSYTVPSKDGTGKRF